MRNPEDGGYSVFFAICPLQLKYLLTLTVKPLEFASVVAGRKPCQCHARMAELVDALASGVSVLTDVRVQVPLFAPIGLLRRIQG